MPNEYPPPPPPRTHAEITAWCRRDPDAAMEYALGLFAALSADDRAVALEEIEDLRLRAELRGISPSGSFAAGLRSSEI